jgi:hypothetical protein
MKIIRFPLVQRDEKATIPNNLKASSSLLLQYRDGASDEFLVWAICVVCAVASIVLCFSQLQSDVNHIQREHFSHLSASQLADETPSPTDVSKEL